MTASPTLSPMARSASSLSRFRMNAETSCGVYSRAPSLTFVGEPMRRLTSATVRSGMATSWFLAVSPTWILSCAIEPDDRRRQPLAGLVGDDVRTAASIGRICATSELVVPRSIPTTWATRAPPNGSTTGQQRPSTLPEGRLAVYGPRRAPRAAQNGPQTRYGLRDLGATSGAVAEHRPGAGPAAVARRQRHHRDPARARPAPPRSRSRAPRGSSSDEVHAGAIADERTAPSSRSIARTEHGRGARRRPRACGAGGARSAPCG